MSVVTRWSPNRDGMNGPGRASLLVNGRCPEHGKLGYETKGDARAAARALQGEHRARTRPYPCVVCGAWHLTSLPAAKTTAGGYHELAASPVCAASPWEKLTPGQAKGAHYALRVIRTSPHTPLEHVDEAIAQLALIIVRNAQREQRRAS